MEGNQQKMREALEAIDKNTDLLDIAEDVAPNLHPSHSFVAVQIRKIVRAALSVPPRVCDVNTLESLSDFVEKTILTSDLLKDAPEIVKRVVTASVRTALTIAYEPAKEARSEDLRTMRE